VRKRDLVEGRIYLVHTPTWGQVDAVFLGYYNDRRDCNTRRMPTYRFQGALGDAPIGEFAVLHSRHISPRAEE
jgi:hypothetical protein